MKQKLLKLKALLVVLMMAVGFGQAWADDEVYKTALFGSTYNSGGVSSYTASWYATNDGFRVNLLNWNNNNNGWSYVKAGSKKTASVASITTNAAIDEAVTKVVLTIDAVTASKINSVTLYSGDTSSDISTEEGSFTVSAGAQTVTISTPSKDRFYKIVADCASGSSNGLITVSKIEFYKKVSVDPGKTETTTAFDGESSYDVELGEEFVGPTATVSDGTSVIGGASVTYSSSNTAVATVDATTGAVTLVGAGETTITASYEGDETYASSSASYELTVTKPVPVFASLEELVADENVESGDIVNVSFQNVEIKSVYVSSAQKRQGIYFNIQKGDNDIEIYYSAEEVPETWVAGGTVSGTMQCPWKDYKGTWELAPEYNTWSWDNLVYVAPAGAKTTATIEFTAKSKLEVGSADEFDVTYNGDGVLEVNSTNEDVATVAIEAGHVVVTAIATGTTVITVSAPETDEYTEASKQYTLTVSPAKQAFDRNVHKALVAEKDGRYYAAYNTISGSNTYFTVKEVTVYNNKVYFQNDEDASDIAWNITIDDTDATKATVQNLYGDYLVLGTKTAVSLSSNENELYANEDGGFYYASDGRGFAYNPNAPRMAGYNVGGGYPAAKAMSFAGDEDAPMRITSAGWATFYAPFPVAIPEGVTAYTGTMMDDWIQLNELTEGCIPAATGVVVAKAVEGDAFVASLTPVDFVPSVPVSSCYTGNTTGAIMNVSVGDYLLQKNFDDEKKEDVVGWYKVSGEGFTLAPNRCYLSKDDVPAPNQSRTFFGFAPDDATGINSIATEAKTKADGKYIVKGQIVVVKAGKAYNMNGTEVK